MVGKRLYIYICIGMEWLWSMGHWKIIIEVCRWRRQTCIMGEKALCIHLPGFWILSVCILF